VLLQVKRASRVLQEIPFVLLEYVHDRLSVPRLIFIMASLLSTDVLFIRSAACWLPEHVLSLKSRCIRENVREPPDPYSRDYYLAETPRS
jgi:hypothetical protein